MNPLKSSPMPFLAAGLGILLLSLNATAAPGRGVERQVERGVERQVGRQVERQVERGVDKQVENNVGRQVDQKVERQVERRVEQQAARRAGERGSDKIDQQVEGQLDKALPEQARGAGEVPPGLERAAQNPNAAAALERAGAVERATQTGQPVASAAESEIGRAPGRYFDIAVDKRGDPIIRGEWLLVLDADQLRAVRESGLTIASEVPMPGLAKTLVEVRGEPDAFMAEHGFEEAMQALLESGDYNHLYRLEGAESADADAWMPADAIALPPAGSPASQSARATLGLIDTDVSTGHPALRDADIEQRRFLPNSLPVSTRHGTAIASILVGESEDYRGLLSRGRLLTAGVFYQSEQYGEVASVRSLVLALDWMIRSGVRVVNMSLTGPPNSLLREAVAAASEQGVVIVAAAGNGGPSAQPVYPAAYPEVIAVTAVNRESLAWFSANRGHYVDIAAPGVNIYHADPEGGYSVSSGTSFAAPFVAAALASADEAPQKQGADQVLSLALDLGEVGRDPVYGHGLLQWPVRALSASP